MVMQWDLSARLTDMTLLSAGNSARQEVIPLIISQGGSMIHFQVFITGMRFQARVWVTRLQKEYTRWLFITVHFMRVEILNQQVKECALADLRDGTKVSTNG